LVGCPTRGMALDNANGMARLGEPVEGDEDTSRPNLWR